MKRLTEEVLAKRPEKKPMYKPIIDLPIGRHQR